MAEKKLRYIIPITIAILILYIFLFPQHLLVEPKLSPKWLSKLDTKELLAPQIDDPRAIPFESQHHFGYIAPTGSLYQSLQKGENSSISEDAWASYANKGDKLELNYVKTGKTVQTEVPGYPWFSGGRTWIIGPEQNAISLIDKNGLSLWTRHFNSPITCLEGRGEVLAIGLLEGRLIILNNENKLLFDFLPGASRIQVIYGLALSEDARFIALTCGLDRQRVLLLERTPQAWKVIWHQFTDSDFRRPTFMKFIHSDRLLMYEDVAGVNIIDTKYRKIRHIESKGRPLAASDEQGDGIIFILSATDNGERILTGIKNSSFVFFEAQWDSYTNFLHRQGDLLLLSGENALAGILLEAAK